jgi:hypothetical protein
MRMGFSLLDGWAGLRVDAELSQHRVGVESLEVLAGVVWQAVAVVLEALAAQFLAARSQIFFDPLANTAFGARHAWHSSQLAGGEPLPSRWHVRLSPTSGADHP